MAIGMGWQLASRAREARNVWPLAGPCACGLITRAPPLPPHPCEAMQRHAMHKLACGRETKATVDPIDAFGNSQSTPPSRLLAPGQARSPLRRMECRPADGGWDGHGDGDEMRGGRTKPVGCLSHSQRRHRRRPARLPGNSIICSRPTPSSTGSSGPGLGLAGPGLPWRSEDGLRCATRPCRCAERTIALAQCFSRGWLGGWLAGWPAVAAGPSPVTPAPLARLPLAPFPHHTDMARSYAGDFSGARALKKRRARKETSRPLLLPGSRRRDAFSTWHRHHHHHHAMPCHAQPLPNHGRSQAGQSKSKLTYSSSSSSFCAGEREGRGRGEARPAGLMPSGWAAFALLPAPCSLQAGRLRVSERRGGREGERGETLQFPRRPRCDGHRFGADVPSPSPSRANLCSPHPHPPAGGVASSPAPGPPKPSGNLGGPGYTPDGCHWPGAVREPTAAAAAAAASCRCHDKRTTTSRGGVAPLDVPSVPVRPVRAHCPHPRGGNL
ncbi:hypothetical protein MPTK2_1g20020 [Marchantia polymorpha subsp. ruderalis]